MTDANTSTNQPSTADIASTNQPSTADIASSPSASKPTDEWVTGDEPITGPQASYLETLAHEAGETVPDGLTKAQASELIDRLQQATGRGEQ